MLHSFHLARVTPPQGAAALLRRPTPSRVPGLRAAEAFAGMQLGAPVLSPSRFHTTRLAMFAAWDDEAALDEFLASSGLGNLLSKGWHVRMQFLRRWGHVEAFGELPEEAERSDPCEPIVAVTLARMRLPRLARFIHWGRPVEQQVRDDPATTISLAAIRPPRTVSTFSIWRTTREMTSMTFGRGSSPGSQRHVRAMAERERRDFHHEFTTLRFRPLSEHGMWEGRGDYVPGFIDRNA